MAFNPADFGLTTASIASAIPKIDITGTKLDSAISSAKSFVQKTFDFSSPSAATKEVEALGKLASQKTIAGFDSVSRGIGLTTTAEGVTSAIDNATGKVLGSVTNPQANLSANLVPTSSDNNTIKLKVTLTQEPALLGVKNQVILDVMPTISESKSATYQPFNPNQHPGEILKYTGSTSRSWSVEARLISRDIGEANDNLDTVNLIRSWVMPFYGEGTSEDSDTGQYLGAPPPIITLSAYGPQMIGPSKCVVENYHVNWPNDVDFITTDSGQPFPVIVSISISLKESWSPAEYSSFDLFSYRVGSMPNAFNTARIANSPPPPPNTASEQVQAVAAVKQSGVDVSVPAIVSQASVAAGVPQNPIWSGKNPIAESQAQIRAVQGPAGKEWGTL